MEPQKITGIIDQSAIDRAVAATSTKGSSATGEFDPDMFIKILMEQLKNQNPFDSVDTSEIVQQQATLSQVEQSARQTESLKAVQEEVASQFQSVSQTLVEMKNLLAEIKNK